MATPIRANPFPDDENFTQMYKKVEQFTGSYAQALVDQSGIVTEARNRNKLTVLDMACGTAIVSSVIMTSVPTETNVDITCADVADAMVAAASARIAENAWLGKAIKADAQDSKLPSDHFTHVFFNFGPGVLPDTHKGVSECYRVLQPGGTFGCTSWITVAWLPDLQECFQQHPELPRLPSEDEFLSTFSKEGAMWRDPETVKSVFLEGNSFVDVRVERVDRETVFERGYKEVVERMAMILGLLFSHWFSAEQKQEYMGKIENNFAEFLKQKYGEDGKIMWQWSAVVATARKPK